MTKAGAVQAAGLDPERIPRHVAIIMDGNGRWARGKGWQRSRGHHMGAQAVHDITVTASDLGIEQLTLYAFSSENWSRPWLEIEVLMHLLIVFLRSEFEHLVQNQVRLTAIGDLDRLPAEPRRVLDETITATAHHQGMTLTLALSYGGRDEIAAACRTLAQEVAAGTRTLASIDAAAIQTKLYDPAAADVDVVIRTAGEQRLSNFLLWQTAYAEYVSLPQFWPEMNPAAFHEALRLYQARERRFGKI